MRMAPSIDRGALSWRTPFARSESESANPGLWRGLLGCWPSSFGPTGSRLFDASGRNFHGTFTNMDPTDWAISDNPKLPGYVVDLDGSNDHIQVAHNDVLTLPRFSLSFWLLIRATPESYPLFIANDLSTKRNYSLAVNGTALSSIWWRLGSSGGSTTVDISPFTLVLNQWHHFVLSYDAAFNKILYIDGQERASDVGTSAPNQDTGQQVFLGGGAEGFGNLDGQMANILIYNRAISVSEKIQLYEDSMSLFRRKPIHIPYTVQEVAPPAAASPEIILQAVNRSATY